MALNVVILAAGKGTRMYSKLPKVLHEVAGTPMLFHVINTAYSLNPSKIIVVLGHESELIEKRMGSLDTSIKEKIRVVIQKEQNGTAHALMCAMPALDESGNVLVLYGDTPLTPKDALTQLTDKMSSVDMSLLSTCLEDPHGYGRIIRNKNNEVVRIVEQKDATAEEARVLEVNTGMICIKKAALDVAIAKIDNNNAQNEYYLTDLVGILASSGSRVEAVQYKDSELLQGVNNKLQLSVMERLYQRHMAKKLMLMGVTIADPQRIDIRGTLKCGQDCFIDTNVIFEGDVVLGDNVTISTGCVIRDCSIGDNSVISPYSVLEKSVMKKHNTIGPFSRLRPGNVLEDEVHVGNFVEVKNSKLGYGTKSGHLSYLGDSEIGRDVNIGAGTITCNYDGANKHKTILGDDVFIGSDTQLVAPVTVANGVTIGAGSTVTTDVKDENALYISRARGRTLHHYIRPKKNK